MKTVATTPTTLKISPLLKQKIERRCQKHNLSLSELVRLALLGFDFGTFQAKPKATADLSFRLSPNTVRFLRTTAKQRKTQVSKLVLAALESFTN